jgi:hypothetical protein
MTFAQIIQYESCSKYSNLSSEKVSYFYEVPKYSSRNTIDFCVDWKFISKKLNLLFHNGTDPPTRPTSFVSRNREVARPTRQPRAAFLPQIPAALTVPCSNRPPPCCADPAARRVPTSSTVRAHWPPPPPGCALLWRPFIQPSPGSAPVVAMCRWSLLQRNPLSPLGQEANRQRPCPNWLYL